MAQASLPAREQAGSAFARVRGRVGLMVLGCAKNQVEAETMSARLTRAGWALTSDFPNADAVVVHSCGFLAAARREARVALADLRRANPRGRLILSGCFAQYVKGRGMPKVEILGTGDFDRLPEVLDGRPAPTLASPPSGYHDAGLARPLRRGQRSAYLRVGEGCDHRCAFCLIPQLRGPLRSRPMDEIVAEARDLAARGVRELVLISQDTSAYGMDRGGPGLTALLRRLARVPGVAWLRILYAYPTEVGEDLIDLLAEEPKLLGYLDMPLQHFSGRVLRAMGREGGPVEIRLVLDRLARRVPRLSLRTTFIVGFPGETEADFRELLALVGEGRFEHMGVFPYSAEPRSPSAKLPGSVPAGVMRERWQRLLDAQRRVKERRDRDRIGKRAEVLVESSAAGGWTARAPHQAPEVDGEVRLADPPPGPGFLPVVFTGTDGIDLLGRTDRPARGAEAP